MKLAKLIRVVTVPPVMALWLILTLRLDRSGYFPCPVSFWAALFFLTVLPLLAYPLSALLPPLKARGREGQRDLAMGLSVLGYLGGWLFGRFGPCGQPLLFIFGTYLFSVLTLLVFNKLLRLRASGHACSVAGPALCLLYLQGGWWTPVCIGVYAASFWASVRTGRHSPREYLLGTLSVLIAMGLAWLVWRP